MTNSGQTLRLTALQTPVPHKHAPMGMWYAVKDTQDLFFVFTVFHNGILCVFGAQLNQEYTVSQVIPLSAHAKRIYKQLSPGLLTIYTQRIENAAVHWRKYE